MRTILFIDTASNEEISVGLRIREKKFVSKRKVDKMKAQVVLPMIEQLLKKHKMSLEQIDAVEVNTGPGSFTGLRVGISIANALGFLLQIPVNKKPLGEIVQASYT